MILIQTEMNGKEYYKPLSFEEAMLREDPDKLIFTDEDEKANFFDIQKMMKEAEDKEKANKEADRGSVDEMKGEEERTDTESDIKEEANWFYEKNEKLGFDPDNLGDFISRMVNSTRNWVSDALIGSFGGNDDSRRQGSRTAKLLRVLPFMDEADIDEIVEDILENKEEYRGIKLTAIMPFCTKETCDKLFMAFVEDGRYEGKLEALAPFVSEKCMTWLVDEYLKGHYPNLKIDYLYPFMSSTDVKRVFRHILHEKEEN